MNGDCSKSSAGTRVFKKASPSNAVTVYLGKRDYVDFGVSSDPVDGVILVDEALLGSRKVFVHVLAAFHYGRDELDVLGMMFRKDLFFTEQQIYPPLNNSVAKPLTKLQDRLLKKLGGNARPFLFTLPHSSPASVTLQPSSAESGKPCGIDYELKCYVGDSATDRPHKKDSVRLAIRKLVYAPAEPGPQPCAELVKELTFSNGHIRLETSLEREKYYHGEVIPINVLIDNNSSRSIKRLKVSIRQYADICLFSTAQYICSVAETETTDGVVIPANQTGWCQVFHLTPLLANNRDRKGLALDGKIKHEDTNLASSTLCIEQREKENLGIVVQYKVKVKLILGFGSGDVSVELPFVLTHPPPLSQSPLLERTSVVAANGCGEASSDIADHNLIDFDCETEEPTAHRPDELVFEDFARMRLAARLGGETFA